MYLPGGYLPGGVPTGGLPAQGGVPARGGVDLPGGVPARGCTCPGVYPPRYSPPVNRMTDRCKNTTFANFVCGQ